MWVSKRTHQICLILPHNNIHLVTYKTEFQAHGGETPRQERAARFLLGIRIRVLGIPTISWSKESTRQDGGNRRQNCPKEALQRQVLGIAQAAFPWIGSLDKRSETVHFNILGCGYLRIYTGTRYPWQYLPQRECTFTHPRATQNDG